MTIEVEALTKRYREKFAVKNVSFTVESGKVTGFLGPNGAGKSTTMRSIVGLDRPTSGRARIDGMTYSDFPAPLGSVGGAARCTSSTSIPHRPQLPPIHRCDP